MPDFDNKYLPLINAGRISEDEACRLTGYEKATGRPLEHVGAYMKGSTIETFIDTTGRLVNTEDGVLGFEKNPKDKPDTWGSVFVGTMPDGTQVAQEAGGKVANMFGPNHFDHRTIISDGPVALLKANIIEPEGAPRTQNAPIAPVEGPVTPDQGVVLPPGENKVVGNAPATDETRRLFAFVKPCGTP
jgi:hypothetical protein